MASEIEINVLGDLQLVRGGQSVTLPPSRKTRALLAYLAVVGRPQRRERLCEMFWDVPDDPRGALRWSLTKLRPLLNRDGAERLTADRERVEIVSDDLNLDLRRVQTRADDPEAAFEDLAEAWRTADNILLDDCELANQPAFAVWLARERQALAQVRAGMARRLALDFETGAD